MDQSRSHLLRSIFDAAAERPPASREAFVIEAAHGDSALAAEVLSLLSALDTAGEFLDTDAGTLFDLSAPEAPSPSLATGEAEIRGVEIGGFRLLKLIGRGGMGSVYEAEQESPRRRVALKVLKSWDVTSSGRRRFIEEANILARLQHPGIAHVFSAGVHSLGPLPGLLPALASEQPDAPPVTGVPWIAMELVDAARPLTEFCESSRLDVVHRLNLFLAVCDAVHHGHVRGVIHRDLKPQNILVDRAGTAKVIDFGVARALADPALKPSTESRTLDGALIGTLRYMSPEQCDGQAASADTRTDVYALGVILYELLTSAAPYDLDGLTLSAAARRVVEAPVIPPRRFTPKLPRDLETIVLRALEKSPGRRYQTVFEFAADLRRYLAREPIHARPSTALYRLTRFARRRPALMVLSVLAICGLVAGIIGISVGLAHERAARRESDTRREQAERQSLLANLFAADSDLTRGDGGSALRRLAAIPPDRRGWEWRYLSRRSDSSVQHWSFGPEICWLFPSPRGDLIARHFGHRLEMYNSDQRSLRWGVDGAPNGGTSRWSRDGRFLAVPGNFRIAIMDASTGQTVRDISLGTKDLFLGAGWSPDDTLLAVGTSDAQGLLIFDTQTGKLIHRAPTHSWVYDADFSADGKLLAWSDLGEVVVMDVSSHDIVRRIPIDRTRPPDHSSIRFSPIGRKIAVTCGNTVVFVDLDDVAKPPLILRGHAQRVYNAEFDATASHLVTSSIDKTLRVWDLSNPVEPMVLLGHETFPDRARFLPGDSADPSSPLIISTDESGMLRWWAPFAGTSPYSSAISGSRQYVSQICFDRSGSLMSAVAHEAVMTWDLRGKPRLQNTFLSPHPEQRISTESPYAAAIVDSKNVILFSLDTGVTKWSHDLGDRVLPLRFSPDASILAAVTLSGKMFVFRVADGTELGTAKIGNTYAEVLEISHDSRRLLVRGTGGELRMWDLTTFQPLATLCPDGEAGPAVNFSTDDQLVAFSDRKGGMAVWSVKDARVIRQMSEVNTTVWCAAISPDGQRLAAGGFDRVARVYDMHTGDELLQLRNHLGSVMTVQWSPDGRYLCTGGYDQRVFIYDGSPNPAPDQVRTDRRQDAPR